MLTERGICILVCSLLRFNSIMCMVCIELRYNALLLIEDALGQKKGGPSFANF